jgi:hypothetical protein
LVQSFFLAERTVCFAVQPTGVHVSNNTTIWKYSWIVVRVKSTIKDVIAVNIKQARGHNFDENDHPIKVRKNFDSFIGIWKVDCLV